MPKAAPKAEMAKTVDSFFADDGPALDVVDRATLEDYADCPAKARFIHAGHVNVVAAIMASGTEIHDALSQAVGDYVASRNALNPSDIADAARGYLFGSRPDLQPDAIRGMRASLYHWSRYIGSIHCENILAFDGGTGTQSGQLAYDFKDLGVRVTSEIDLLHAGRSPDLLHEVDYKTGHKVHNASGVYDAFQFQLHALLVFEAFPEAKALQTEIWNTRQNRRSWRVEFKRDDRSQFLYRVRKAVEAYVAHRDSPAALAPTWPTVEKCGFCPAAALCPASGDDTLLLEHDMARFVDETAALSAKLDARIALMAAAVKRSGEELRGSNGNAFGLNKPKKRETAPKPALYQVVEDEPDETEGET